MIKPTRFPQRFLAAFRGDPSRTVSRVASVAGLTLVIAALWSVVDRPSGSDFDHADAPEPSGPVWEVRSSDEVAALPAECVAVRAVGSAVTDELLADLVTRQPALEALEIHDGEVTDSGLDVLRRLPHLTRLGLPHCARITDAGIETLVGLGELTDLDLEGWVGQVAFGPEGPSDDWVDPYSKLTPNAMTHLVRMPKLRSLGLSGTRMDDAAVAILVEAGPPALRRLDLSGSRIGKHGLRLLVGFDQLHHLALESRPSLEDDDLVALAGMSRLRSLSLGGNGFTLATFEPRGLRALATDAKLETLSFSYAVLSEAGIRSLARSPSLQDLALTSCKGLTDASLAAFAELPSFERLDLSYSVIGVEPAKVKGQLMSPFELRGTLSDDTLARFAERKPACVVVGPDAKPLLPQLVRLVLHDGQGRDVSGAIVAFVDAAGAVAGVAKERVYVGTRRELYRGPRRPRADDTDPATVYALGGLEPGVYAVRIHAPDHAPRELTLVVRPGEMANRVEALEPIDGARWAVASSPAEGRSLQVKVVDEAGRHCAEPIVFLTSVDDGGVLCRASAVWELENVLVNDRVVPPGRYDVTALVTGYRPVSAILEIASDEIARPTLVVTR